MKGRLKRERERRQFRIMYNRGVVAGADWTSFFFYPSGRFSEAMKSHRGGKFTDEPRVG